MPVVLVTGGAGYVGSHAVLELLPHFQVIVFDNLSRGHRRLVPAGAEFIQGNLHDTARLADMMQSRRVEAVLHFSAYAYVGESVADPGLYFSNNVAGTLSLLNAMRQAGVQGLIFSSSCTVYGLPQSNPIHEDHPLAPISPYGQSKLMMEQILPAYEQAHGLRFFVLRYFNAAGCDAQCRSGELHDPEPHVIPRLLLAAQGRLPHFGILGDRHATPDGTCIRDYVHVTDLAVAHRQALQLLLDGHQSTTCNLGTGHGFSVRELIQAAEMVTGRSITVRIEPPRPGDPAGLVADARRARTILGWSPSHSSMPEILSSAWRWQQSQ